MPRLENKIALITGGASGIGYAAAERFVAEGATVILADRSKDSLLTSHARLCGDDARHRAVHLDVTLEEDWIRVTREIEGAFGRLDILVNNAGSGHPPRSVETFTLQEWRAGIAVNLDSVFLGTKYSMPLLARSGRGSIINTASIMGLVSLPNSACYCAAKAAVCMLTKSTALDCAAAGNGVRANAICPGQIRTPMLMNNIDDATAKEFVSRIPVGRMGEPREIAEAIVFLASDESSFMTGTQLTLDGGYTSV